MKVIFDKYGEPYQIAIIEGQISLRFELKFQDPRIKGSLIGYANFVGKNTDTCSLADIQINEKAYIFRPQLGFFGWFKKAKPIQRNFRRLGLGTSFLQYALEDLKARGCKKVIGQIVDHDLAKNPNLPKWYSEMGFDVIDGSITKQL